MVKTKSQENKVKRKRKGKRKWRGRGRGKRNSISTTEVERAWEVEADAVDPTQATPADAADAAPRSRRSSVSKSTPHFILNGIYHSPSSAQSSSSPPPNPTPPPSPSHRKKIKKQRSVVDRMKRLHSKFKSKKNKQRREKIIFGLKVFGAVAITVVEIAIIILA